MTDAMPEIRPLLTTGIGSLPHTDAGEAAALCLESFDIPFWPQLPNLGLREHMVPQYSEGMPGIRTDPERGAAWVERSEEEIARFYETCTDGARIAISEESARGFYAFLRLIKGRTFDMLKGHITGPLTYTLGLSDPGGRPIYYDEELRQISLMLLGAKARWQVDMLKPFAREVVIFIDEPILSALGGTTYMGVGREEALRMLRETASAVREAGGIPGIHCCGRAEWPLVMQSGVRIMNFDAPDYGDTLAIYPEETRAFLEGGGILAWGAVPTTDLIVKATPRSVLAVFQDRLSALSRAIPGDLLMRNIMLTPTCGTGSRTVEETLKVFQLLMRLKEDLS